MKYRIIFIFTAALLIRLIAVNQSLWLDEATTARVVQQYTFWEIISKFSPNDFHPPLYYLFMKVWTNIFGYSEIALRMPSVLFCLLTGFFIYKMAKWLNGYMVGVWAVAFFLFNPLIVYYSQEARMYMMATFLLTVTLYFFTILCHAELVSASDLKIRSRNPTSSTGLRGTSKFGMTNAFFLFNIFSILAFVTFYGSIFLIIPMILHLLYKKEYKFFLISSLIILFSILILAPLLYQQLINAKQQLQLIPNWSQVLGSTNLKNLLLIPVKFSIGRISFSPKWIYWLISGGWTVYIWLLVVLGGLKNRLLFFLLISPLIIGTVFSIFSPLLQYFRFIYLIPIISLLIALGQARFDRFGQTWIILAGFLVFSGIYLFNPDFHREDWKSLAKDIAYETKIYMIKSSSDPLRYYRGDLTVLDLRDINSRINTKEISVIPYSAEIHGVDYQRNLKFNKYKLLKVKSYRGISIEKWSKLY